MVSEEFILIKASTFIRKELIDGWQIHAQADKETEKVLFSILWKIGDKKVKSDTFETEEEIYMYLTKKCKFKMVSI